MKIGLALENFVPPGGNVDVQKLAKMAKLAEENGFESVWTWDHLLLGSKKVYPILEPVTALSYVSAFTSKIKLGTIYVLPLRTPLVAAKLISSLNYISRNRLMLTVVAGWYEKEFLAVGTDFARRGRILSDYLKLIRRLLKESDVNEKLGNMTFVHANIEPKGENIKIFIGAYLENPIKRVAKLSDGWMAYYYKEEDFAQGLKIIERHSLGRALENSDMIPVYVGEDGRQKVHEFTKTYMDLPEWSKCSVESGIYGTEKDVADRIESYKKVGVSRLVLIPAFYELEQVEKLGKIIRDLQL
jgi:Coenzyme F420-dependent N5,N10-methylene tetrahydromethanopterin reductase and related flavin-dependent oxidoreductases